MSETTNTFYEFDKRGVRAFTRYSEATGKWCIECYRKKTVNELAGEHDWKMIRVGHINSYDSREEAELKALKLAEEICIEYGF